MPKRKARSTKSPKYMHIATAAKKYKFSVSTIRKWIKDGDIVGDLESGIIDPVYFNHFLALCKVSKIGGKEKTQATKLRDKIKRDIGTLKKELNKLDKQLKGKGR